MSHHIVEARNVSYTFPDGTKVLNDISFKITHGESVAIVGANGAGKSTLLLHLNGYLSASRGEVLIGDYTINKKTLKNVRRTVGMIFQNPDDQLFMPTVFEDVAFGPLNLGFSNEEVEKRVNSSLETVGALKIKNRPPYKLSGGEKRAVSIATVLSMSPDILVMDEPSSNLDPSSRRNLIILLKKFKHTKIIATHDLDMALDLCERTIIIHNGAVQADGLTKELFKNKELLAKNSLEMPLRLQACPVCNT